MFKEAALNSLSTLRSQTCFRDEDGWLYGWEGIDDRRGSCPGSCTHVWNYELVTGQLFPDLARLMREVEFLHCTDGEGRMNFRVKLPLAANADMPVEERQAAADGQLGCIVRFIANGGPQTMMIGCGAAGRRCSGPWRFVGSKAAGMPMATA